MRKICLPVLCFLACAPRMDEHFLKYETYPALSSKASWRLIVMPPVGYMQYSELPKEPYGRFWVYLTGALASTGRFQIVSSDTIAIRAKITEKAPGWENFPEPGTAKAVGFEMGAEAVCVVEIEEIKMGYRHNDPAEPMYYETVIKLKIFDTGKGDLLYNATARGIFYEDLAGSLNQAADNALKPLK
ncbi:MAG: hypothetical protein ABIM46_04025 [candidate division WOR-3 bacterium]